MKETIAGLVIFLTLLALLVFMTWVVDVTGAAEPPLEAKEAAQYTQEVQSASFLLYSPSLEPEPTEPTVEELVESGYLLDDISLSYDLQMVARDAAELFDVPYGILLATMYEESRFDPDAVNYNETCFGLMQINRCNFEWLHGVLAEYGVTDIQNDPEGNILAGAYMLADLYTKYGDWHLALMAYNCGENGAKKQWDSGYYSSEYSRTIISLAFDG